MRESSPPASEIAPAPTPPAAARATTTPQRTETPPARPEVTVPNAVLVNLDTVKWVDAPPALPKGAKVAVLEGAPPFPADQTFTLLAKLPKNYAIPPHTHLVTERVTVLDGMLSFGHGEKLDRKAATKVKAGGLVLIPPNHAHYAFTTDQETTIALSGVGPWEIIYINPKDDPRPTPARMPDKPVARVWEATVDAKIVQPADVKFVDPQPGTMPAGAKIAVLEGDPQQAKTFTFRLRLTKGFKFPIHAHSYTDRFMVLAGNVKFAMGDTWSDADMMLMKRGGVGIVPKEQMHYAEALDNNAIVQISGVGPFDVKYMNPADAPSK